MYSDGKESACNSRDPGLIPGSRRFLGEGNGYPLQCACLRNPMDRGTWQATVHRVAKSWTQLHTAHKPLGRLYTIFSSFKPTYLLSTFIFIKRLFCPSYFLPFSLVQFSHSLMSDSLQPPGLQHIKLLCPSPSPGVCPNSCPLNPWCHPTISSSVILFSFCLQSFPASESFQMSWLFASGGQSVGV